MNVYEATGRRDDALKLAKTLVDKDPKNAALNDMYGALLLQNTATGNGPQSVSDLKGLVQKNPEDGALHMELARAYFGNNEIDKAQTEALQAMQAGSEAHPRRDRPC